MSNGSAAQFPAFRKWANAPVPGREWVTRRDDAAFYSTDQKGMNDMVMSIIRDHVRDTLNAYALSYKDSDVSADTFKDWTCYKSWSFHTYDVNEEREIFLWGYDNDIEPEDNGEEILASSAWYAIEGALYGTISGYAREALLSLTKDYAKVREKWEAEQED